MRPRRRWPTAVIPAALVLAPAIGWAVHAALTWRRFGRRRPGEGSDPLMQRFVPRHDIAEVHWTRVAAPAATTFAAARAMDLQRSAIVRAIFRSRELLMRAEPEERARHVPLVRDLLSLGWGVLAERPGRQVVLGAVTQPWRADVVFRALPPDDFAAFDEPGYVKIAFTLAAEPAGPRACVFRTETRAVATDRVARERFRRYWSLFSPGILLIRRQALALVRREAERRSRASRRARVARAATPDANQGARE